MVALALVLTGVPIAAQDPTSSPAVPHGLATPQENLDCAAWVFNLLGSGVDDPQAQVGLAAAFGWFLGLYEAQAGTISERVMQDRAVAMTNAEIASVAGRCVERMTAFGEQVKRDSDGLPSAADNQ